ncbi:MAG: Holliday junction branch migration protein RuvA [Clostridia bacterium]|nr:Holliday junction branch migration protein RuvA [Clostridia bacterium]
MYAHLNGTLTDKGEGQLVIECAGVGYLLNVSANTLQDAPAVGENMKCYTILSVREDAMELFGFSTRAEKQMFLKLTSVTGVGPKSALGILSALRLRDLSVAIVTGDAQAISKAPGIGKKTAQRIILELKDKVDNDDLTSSQRTLNPGILKQDAVGEAIEALIALGYQPSEATRAISGLSPMPESSEGIIRLALKGMMK